MLPLLPRLGVAVAGVFLSSTLLTLVSEARAQTTSSERGSTERGSTEANSSEANRATHCTHLNALSAIACEIRRQLPSELNGVKVVAGIPAAPELTYGVRLADLGARLSAVVAGQFSDAQVGAPGSLGAARAGESKHAHLLYLSSRLNGVQFEVTADVYTLVRSFWDRAKPQPGALHHAFATRRMDAEIASHFPVPPLVASHTTRAGSPTGHVVALACGDLDGDRALELLVVGRQDVYVGRIRDGALQVHGTRAWRQLSPVAPRPLQEPLAGAHVQSGEYAEIGSTDRAEMIRLGPELEVLARFSGRLPWGGLGCGVRGGLAVLPGLVDCDSGQDRERVPFAAELDAFAGGNFLTRAAPTNNPINDNPVRVIAARARGEDTVQLFDSEGRQAQLRDSGAQIAIADLNRDGIVELITSRNTLDRRTDGVRVHSWQPQGLSLAYELDVPSGVDALAACPPEDLGVAPFVIATGREIWVTR